MPRRKKATTIKSNYPISDTFRSTLRSRAETLLMRNVRLHEAFCPLTVDELCNGYTTETDRIAIQHLRHGEFAVGMTDRMHIWVRDAGMPASSKLSFYAPQGYPFVSTHRDPLVFDLDTLDPEKREVFVDWVNAATRQRRIFKGTKALTDAFAGVHCGASLASMHTRWPEFSVVALTMEDPWPARVRALTGIHRSEYGWPRSGATYEWYLDNMRRMEITGGLLAEAQMLVVPDDKSPVKVEVVDWKVPVG